MESKDKYSGDIDAIRSIMEKSTRFLSLSGLSGVFAGLIAIAGTAAAIFLLFRGHLDKDYFAGLTPEEVSALKHGLLTDAVIVLLAAAAVALFFSYRRASSQGVRFWTPVTRRLLASMMIPLVSGGLFIIVLLTHELYWLIIPSMLIFYGLALVNAGKFTYGEIFYLGLIEIAIGFLSALVPEFGILFWCLGFGVLHVLYGLIMFRKYER